MYAPSTGYLSISKIKIDVSISGDMSLYRGTFDLLIEGRLQIRRLSQYRVLSRAIRIDFYVNVKGRGIYMQLKYLTRHTFPGFFWVTVLE